MKPPTDLSCEKKVDLVAGSLEYLALVELPALCISSLPLEILFHLPPHLWVLHYLAFISAKPHRKFLEWTLKVKLFLTLGR
jgi:hypothetical protein